MTFVPDILIEVDFPWKDEEFTVRTNAKREALDELLVDWLRSQMGQGADESPIEEHPVYKLKLGFRVSDDGFALESNCGNKGLEAGILGRVMALLSKGKGTVKPL